jgi:hypothetical protein
MKARKDRELQIQITLGEILREAGIDLNQWNVLGRQICPGAKPSSENDSLVIHLREKSDGEFNV